MKACEEEHLHLYCADGGVELGRSDNDVLPFGTHKGKPGELQNIKLSEHNSQHVFRKVSRHLGRA